MQYMKDRDRWVYIGSTFWFWFSYALSWSTFALYLRTTRALPVSQVGILIAYFSILTMAFQIPTGLIADRFGRKGAYLAATGIGAVAMMLLASSTTFHAFLATETLFAISRAFFDGAMQARAVEQLHTRNTENFAWIVKLGEQVFSIAVICGGIASSVLTGIFDSYAAPLWASGFLLAAGTLGGWRLIENGSGNEDAHPQERKKTMRELAKETFATVRKNSLLRILVPFAFFQGITFSCLAVYGVLYLEQFFRTKAFSGRYITLFAAAWLIGCLGVFRATRRGSKTSRILGWTTAVGITAYFLLAFGAGGVILSSVALIVLNGVFGAMLSVRNRLIHERAPDSVRTTALSLFSMIVALGIGIGQVVTGYAIGFSSYGRMWFAAAVIFATAFLVMLRRIQKHENE